MKASVAKRWVKALRSGKYKQGRGQLRSRDGRYCCLGVLCELSKLPYDGGSDGIPPCPIAEWAGLRDRWGDLPDERSTPLTNKNDSGHWSFNRIAGWIDKHWEKL